MTTIRRMELEDVFHAFMRAGWDETETIYGESAVKTGFLRTHNTGEASRDK